MSRRLLLEERRITLQERGQLHRGPVQLNPSSQLDSGEVQEIAHDPAQPNRFMMNAPEELTRTVARKVAGEQDFRKSLDRGQRSPKLVRGHGDKIRLDLV